MLRALRPLLATVALVIGSLTLSLGLGEFVLRRMGYQAIYQVYSKESVMWQRDPVLGWSHEPNAQETFVGPRPWPVEFETPISINSLGLRGPELARLPPKGLRVLVLGDSMVAGFEVGYEATFTAVMERMLSSTTGRPVQVLNAGVRGYGADQALLFYRERGAALNPDIVVLWLSPNDVRNNVTIHRMRRRFGKSAFAPQDDGRLRLVGAPVPDYPECSEYRLNADFEIRRVDGRLSRWICALEMSLFDRSALFSFLTNLVPWEQAGTLLQKLYYVGMPAPTSRSTTDGGDRTVEASHLLMKLILRELADEVRSEGHRFVVVSSPEALRWFEDNGVPLEGLTVVSVDRLGAGDDLEYRFKHDSHLNARGHEIVANTLTQALIPLIGAGVAPSEKPQER